MFGETAFSNFTPHINKTSKSIAATLAPLPDRQWYEQEKHLARLAHLHDAVTAERQREETFRPKINAKSSAMIGAASDEGRVPLVERTNAPRPLEAPRDPEMTLKPKINEASRRMDETARSQVDDGHLVRKQVQQLWADYADGKNMSASSVVRALQSIGIKDLCLVDKVLLALNVDPYDEGKRYVEYDRFVRVMNMALKAAIARPPASSACTPPSPQTEASSLLQSSAVAVKAKSQSSQLLHHPTGSSSEVIEAKKEAAPRGLLENYANNSRSDRNGPTSSTASASSSVRATEMGSRPRMQNSDATHVDAVSSDRTIAGTTGSVVHTSPAAAVSAKQQHTTGKPVPQQAASRPPAQAHTPRSDVTTTTGSTKRSSSASRQQSSVNVPPTAKMSAHPSSSFSSLVSQPTAHNGQQPLVAQVAAATAPRRSPSVAAAGKEEEAPKTTATKKKTHYDPLGACTFAPAINTNIDVRSKGPVTRDVKSSSGCRSFVDLATKLQKEALEEEACTFTPQLAAIHSHHLVAGGAGRSSSSPACLVAMSAATPGFEKAVKRMERGREMAVQPFEEQLRTVTSATSSLAAVTAARHSSVDLRGGGGGPTEPRPFTLRSEVRSLEREAQKPLLYVDVDLPHGRCGRIGVHRGDSAEQLARNFCASYSLDENTVARLANILEEKLRLVQQEKTRSLWV